jgi:hypothetical protein
MLQPKVANFSEWAYEYALKPCTAAVGFVVVALLWTFLLQHWMDYPFVFLFIAAIMGSSWFGGRIAGFIAVVLSSFLINYFFIPPLYSIKVGTESESFFAAFILFALTMSILSSSRKRSEIEARNARDLLEIKVHDRTAELERSNREIQQSERDLRLLTEAIPQQIWRADVRGSIEYVNKNLRDYVGLTDEPILVQSLFEALDVRDAYLVQDAWKQALETGAPFEVQARMVNAEKDRRWFLIRAFPQRSEEGTIVRWYGVHIDIEDRQREQQSLTARQERLSRLSRNLSMSEVAVSIAHELNQPMTALVTHAYACREWANCDPPNVEKVTATAEKIVQESTRASAVVKRVRSLLSQEEPVRTATDLNLLIEESARLLRDEAIRENVRTSLELDNDLPMVEIDPVQIQQVVINLAKNAIEAMRESTGDRVLSISTRKEIHNEILVTVSDTGPGIPQQVLPEIFEPFFSTKKNGTGIGLAICRSAVEAHSGRISARNSASGGAIVQFTLRMTA